ncbi:MAG: thioesterase [Rubrivivax sp.]|nr:thioesterase [Rubrivivax sp.]
MTTSPWLTSFLPRPNARVRLFCFSYAGGGGAVYRPFALALPDTVEALAVLLPGRERRLREPALASISAIVEGLVPALRDLLDRPFAFFGHSMGALVAFELARALPAYGLPSPGHLMISARRAPHLREPDPPLSHLPDDAFIAAIDQRYGGIPAEILQHRDVLELLLPALRADMAAIENHRHEPGPTLPCPIAMFGGHDDTRAGPDLLAPWQEQTQARTLMRQFAGGHFYFNDAGVRGQLIAEMTRLLQPLLAPPCPVGAP